MNCTQASPCQMCELDRLNSIEPQEPTVLECGIAGLGIALSVWVGVAVVGSVAALVVKYNSVTGSLVICLTSGFLYGVWARLRR